MIRPEELAHRNYKLIESTVDGYLRDHEWHTAGRTCCVPLRATPDDIELLLARYRELGWSIEYEADGPRHLYHFTMPDFLVLDTPITRPAGLTGQLVNESTGETKPLINGDDA